MSELRAYQPSWRDRLALALIGDNMSVPRLNFVEGLLGSTGLGTKGVGLLDFTPAGGLLGAQEAISSGDYQDAAVGFVPGARPVKSALKVPVAKFPQYAEVYPPVGPPKRVVDRRTGKEYPAKELTPEAQPFRTERRRIMMDMEKNGYQPYFDPAKREYVDPSHYPPRINTLGIVPKRQSTIDKDRAVIGSEEVRQGLRDARARGGSLPNARDWYALKQVEEEFIKEFGEIEGPKQFANKIAASLSAVTGGADPTTSFVMSQYGNYLRHHNMPVPDAAHQYPYPVGGRFGANNMKIHQKIFDAGGLEGLDARYPKRHDNAQSILGNRNVSVIDEQVTSHMTPGRRAPPPGNVWTLRRSYSGGGCQAGRSDRRLSGYDVGRT